MSTDPCPATQTITRVDPTGIEYVAATFGCTLPNNHDGDHWDLSWGRWADDDD